MSNSKLTRYQKILILYLCGCFVVIMIMVFLGMSLYQWSVEKSASMKVSLGNQGEITKLHVQILFALVVFFAFFVFLAYCGFKLFKLIEFNLIQNKILIPEKRYTYPQAWTLDEEQYLREIQPDIIQPYDAKHEAKKLKRSLRNEVEAILNKEGEDDIPYS